MHNLKTQEENLLYLTTVSPTMLFPSWCSKVSSFVGFPYIRRTSLSGSLSAHLLGRFSYFPSSEKILISSLFLRNNLVSCRILDGRSFPSVLVAAVLFYLASVVLDEKPTTLLLGFPLRRDVVSFPAFKMVFLFSFHKSGFHICCMYRCGFLWGYPVWGFIGTIFHMWATSEFYSVRGVTVSLHMDYILFIDLYIKYGHIHIHMCIYTYMYVNIYLFFCQSILALLL